MEKSETFQEVLIEYLQELKTLEERLEIAEDELEYCQIEVDVAWIQYQVWLLFSRYDPILH